MEKERNRNRKDVERNTIILELEFFLLKHPNPPLLMKFKSERNSESPTQLDTNTKNIE